MARIAHPARPIKSSIVIDRLIRCDLLRVQQIASNLVGNAIAHGAADREIDIRADCDSESFELSAWSQGDPISPSSIGKIFQPFWRQASGREREGLGLGLHICSEIAKAQGGTLTVSSSSQDGTLFVARLPISGPRIPPASSLPPHTARGG